MRYSSINRVAVMTNILSSLAALQLMAQGVPDIVWETNGHTSAIFSPDGSLLASWGGDTFVRFWQVSDGRLVRTLTNEYGNPYFVAFSPVTNSIADRKSVV